MFEVDYRERTHSDISKDTACSLEKITSAHLCLMLCSHQLTDTKIIIIIILFYLFLAPLSLQQA